MIVMSFNVRDWTRDRDESSPTFWKRRRDDLVLCVKEIKPDIICLQECWPKIARPVKELGYESAGTSFSHLILVRKGIGVRRHRFAIFWDWCDLKDGTRIINVHGRWEEKVAKKVVAKVNELSSGQRCVVGGDFNVGLEALRRHGLTLTHARESLGMAKADTFQNYTKPESHGEIDHIFCNLIKPETFRVHVKWYGNGRLSDHWPIVMTY